MRFQRGSVPGRPLNADPLCGGGMPLVEVDEDVQIVDADPRWPAMFYDEATALRRALGPIAVAIEHIGSTAVSGLAAKPIVDILIGTGGDRNEARIVTKLSRLGYKSLGEAGVPGRLYFRKRGRVSCNVHLVLFDGALWKANLAVRNYLRANPKRAAEYALRKREAASWCSSLLAYSQYKASFMDELVRAALLWQASS